MKFLKKEIKIEQTEELKTLFESCKKQHTNEPIKNSRFFMKFLSE